MYSELLSLLESRISKGMRFHEFRENVVHGRAASAAIAAGNAAPHGHYLLVRSPDVPALWAALRASLATGVPLVVVPPTLPFEEQVLLHQLPELPPHGGALILFTSGAAGEPKAVFHSEASLLASARQLAKAFPGDSPTASLLPAWSMAGVMFHCLLPAVRGNDLFFSREIFQNWAAHACRVFGELDVELLTLNPLLLEMLLRSGVDGHYWKGSVVSLAAPLKRSLLASFALACGRRPLEIYGMMEAAGPVLLEGRTLGAEIRVSQTHELELRGKQMFMGYSSNGIFQPHREWLRTGDIFTAEDDIHLYQARTRQSVSVEWKPR